MSVASASSRASIDTDELQLLPSPSPFAASVNSRPPQPRYRSSAGRHPSASADTLTLPHNTTGRTSSPRQHHSPAARIPSSPAQPTASAPSSSSRRRQQQQPQSPSYWASRQLLSESSAPLHWGQDTVSGSQTTGNAPTPAYENDEQFISLFVDEFSSPSTYPSFTNPPTNDASHSTQSRTQTQTHTFPTQPHTVSNHPQSSSRRSNSPLVSISQLSASSAESRHSILDDNIDDGGLTENTSSSSSFSENMPAVARRNPPSRQGTQHPAKRQRTANSKPPQLKDEVFFNSDDSLFGEDPTQPPAVVTDEVKAQEDLTTIDLTEATEVPEELRKPEVDNRVKISAFQCAICMDDVNNLTVTHCGKVLPAILLSDEPKKYLTKFLYNRAPLLQAMSPRIPRRRNDKGQMPHVPCKNRHEAATVVHRKDKGVLAT